MNKILILLIILFPLILQAEPFPERLKDSSQVLICHSVGKNKNVVVVDRTEEWIITWGMAYEWFPNETPMRILFKDTRGLITVLPTPSDYSCTVIPKAKKKDEDK